MELSKYEIGVGAYFAPYGERVSCPICLRFLQTIQPAQQPPEGARHALACISAPLREWLLGIGSQIIG